MIELVQLERRHEEFAERRTRIIAVSVEGIQDATKTQAENPYLVVLADENHSLTDAAGLMHPHAGQDGSDVAAPTTILVDRNGIVRWLYRPDAVITRLSPDEVLKA